MSLITIERESSPLCGNCEKSFECNSERRIRNRSHSEDFFVSPFGALNLQNLHIPDQNRRSSITSPENSLLQNHLKRILSIIRPEDKIKTIVKLHLHCHANKTSVPSSRVNNSGVTRYFCIISCGGIEHTDIEEHAILGLDIINVLLNPSSCSCTDETINIPYQTQSIKPSSKRMKKKRQKTCSGTTHDIKDQAGLLVDNNMMLKKCVENGVSVGLVEPVFQDMKVSLEGDGRFKVLSGRRELLFKPVSIPALWSAVQHINKVVAHARSHRHHADGFTHLWLQYYEALERLAPQRQFNAEWVRMDDVEVTREDVLPRVIDNPTERQITEQLISKHLQKLMYAAEDLDAVTVVQLRKGCEEHFQRSLKEFRNFISEESLKIYGQMDQASKIFDHLYLGSTFNASNLQELEDRNITHILNVTREVDNFFEDMQRFHYKNIRIYDEETSQLLREWQDTHRFINEAKKGNTCCLVHCKLGKSRSASTVIAYAMKEYGWSLDKAYSHVKECRSCIQPNSGFMDQLAEYEGLLLANNFGKPPQLTTQVSATGTLHDESSQLPVYESNEVNLEVILIEQCPMSPVKEYATQDVDDDRDQRLHDDIFQYKQLLPDNKLSPMKCSYLSDDRTENGDIPISPTSTVTRNLSKVESPPDFTQINEMEEHFCPSPIERLSEKAASQRSPLSELQSNDSCEAETRTTTTTDESSNDANRLSQVQQLYRVKRGEWAEIRTSPGLDLNHPHPRKGVTSSGFQRCKTLPAFLPTSERILASWEVERKDKPNLVYSPNEHQQHETCAESNEEVQDTVSCEIELRHSDSASRFSSDGQPLTLHGLPHSERSPFHMRPYSLGEPSESCSIPSPYVKERIPWKKGSVSRLAAEFDGTKGESQSATSDGMLPMPAIVKTSDIEAEMLSSEAESKTESEKVCLMATSLSISSDSLLRLSKFESKREKLIDADSIRPVKELVSRWSGSELHSPLSEELSPNLLSTAT